MTLGKQDAELFYELWFPLLGFVNQKYRICPGVGTIDRSRGVDAADAKKIADYLCSHTQVLQEYIADARDGSKHDWETATRVLYGFGRTYSVRLKFNF